MEPPDTQEKAIRFGCGFAFGALVFAGGSMTLAVAIGGTFLAALVVVGVAVGWLAMRFGDPFWNRLASLYRWWV
ncbi:MAG: hypothetical protein IT181_11830 [Acidobacteria bacterium]|nr:hypothetical protein [Acidobacteriota bacterium]